MELVPTRPAIITLSRLYSSIHRHHYHHHCCHSAFRCTPFSRSVSIRTIYNSPSVWMKYRRTRCTINNGKCKCASLSLDVAIRGIKGMNFSLKLQSYSIVLYHQFQDCSIRGRAAFEQAWDIPTCHNYYTSHLAELNSGMLMELQCHTRGCGVRVRV